MNNTFILFFQALEQSMIFNVSVLVYYFELISRKKAHVSGPLLRRARSLLLISNHHLISTFRVVAYTRFEWIRHNCLFVNLYLLLVWGNQVLILVVNFQLL